VKAAAFLPALVYWPYSIRPSLVAMQRHACRSTAPESASGIAGSAPEFSDQGPVISVHGLA
jgi:hypothetical protein